MISSKGIAGVPRSSLVVVAARDADVSDCRKPACC